MTKMRKVTEHHWNSDAADSDVSTAKVVAY